MKDNRIKEKIIEENYKEGDTKNYIEEDNEKDKNKEKDTKNEDNEKDKNKEKDTKNEDNGKDKNKKDKEEDTKNKNEDNEKRKNNIIYEQNSTKDNDINKEKEKEKDKEKDNKNIIISFINENNYEFDINIVQINFIASDILNLNKYNKQFCFLKLFDNENRLLDFKYEDILVNKNNKKKIIFLKFIK